MNFPFIKRNYETLIGYFDQVAKATAQAKNFGPEGEKLNHEIRKIDNVNGIETLQSMFRSTLEPQNWNDVTAKIYNAAVAYEAASKMTFSAFKLPFHLSLVPLAFKDRIIPMPVIKALGNFAIHPLEVMENAGYVGVLTRQLNAADVMFGERQSSVARQILKKELFEATYKVVRAISGQSAKVYLDQYALKSLRKGDKASDITRRMLSETFLIGDKSIDEAIVNGRFSPEDIGRAQTAFANLTTFSDDPLQMSQLARAEISKGESLPDGWPEEGSTANLRSPVLHLEGDISCERATVRRSCNSPQLQAAGLRFGSLTDSWSDVAGYQCRSQVMLCIEGLKD